jgi:hypothetical protein
MSNMRLTSIALWHFSNFTPLFFRRDIDHNAIQQVDEMFLTPNQVLP